MTSHHSHDDQANRPDDDTNSSSQVTETSEDGHLSDDPEFGDFETDAHRPNPRHSQLTWTTGERYGVGTACARGDDTSRVWFTLTEGALVEPRFPRVDLLQFRLVDFLIADSSDDSTYTARTHDESRTDEEALGRSTEPAETTALVFSQRITAAEDDRDWELTVEYLTDPARDSILMDVEFTVHDDREYDLYVVGEATINGYIEGTVGDRLDTGEGYALGAAGTGDHEPAIRDEDGEQYEVAGALGSRDTFDWATVATYDEDALTALLERGERIDDGDGGEGRVLVGRLGTTGDSLQDVVVLGFDDDGDLGAALDQVRASLSEGYSAVRAAYVEGWEAYLDERPVPDAVAGRPGLEAQYNAALMVLKAVEDRTFRGAGVASPSVPWGENVDATLPRDYGYNFTWARDLYQVFTALSAVDDTERARHAVEYLYEYQQRSDGFLPQNTYLDGRTRWDGEQLDNVAFPAVMAYQLDSVHDIPPEDASYGYGDVRRSLEYLLRSGPRSEQERWEEEAGYSPSTIAAVVAGLGCGAVLAADRDERADALAYLAHADEWRHKVDEWCGTERGTESHDRTPYYVRVSDDGNPDTPTERELANNGPTLDERNIVDAGFLELVRLGLRTHDEEIIRNSLAEVDETIRVETPNGPAWYRYNGDGYGELGASEADEGGPWSTERNGQGRLWPLLTGERAEYELLAGTDEGELAPERLLESLAAFANSGQMLPEQVWDREYGTDFGWEFGEGTGAATPLAWTMAQFVRLAHSIDAGEPVETPSFLAERYRSDPPRSPSLDVSSVSVDGTRLEVAGSTDGEEVVVWTPSGTVHAPVGDGQFDVALELGEAPGDESGAAETDPRGHSTPELAVVAAGGGPEFVDVGTTLERHALPTHE